MAFGECWWARQRTTLPRNHANAIAQRGPASGKRMAFGAAPEPGGPAATSIARQVGSQYLSRGSFPSARVVEPFGLTRGWRRSPTVAALTPYNAAVWPFRLYPPLDATQYLFYTTQ
jgi:hypothetical protein